MIDNHSIGQFKLKTKSIDPLIKPLLYYYYVLKQQRGPDEINVSVEIDHIIPQFALESSTLENKEIKTHNLFNLALLPKKENISKGEKWLKNIDDEWLKDQIALYSGIPINDFNLFSSVQSMGKLEERRKSAFKEAFDTKRDNFFIG